MKLKELDMHCGNCSDDLMELCDRYTPHDVIIIPICCFEKFEELDSDNEKDIKTIQRYCEENLEEWDIEE